MLKQAVQQRPGGGGLQGQFVGPLHLPGDLALADDQAVQTGGDAEQMPDRVAVATLVEVRPNCVHGQAVPFGDGCRRWLSASVGDSGAR